MKSGSTARAIGDGLPIRLNGFEGVKGFTESSFFIESKESSDANGGLCKEAYGKVLCKILMRSALVEFLFQCYAKGAPLALYT